MPRKFNTIGLIGRQRSSESVATLKDLRDYLDAQGYQVIVESETASLFTSSHYPVYSRCEFGKHCDLAIVVGGDGSILNAARAVVDHNVPVLGINRGRLGFLTDIHPNELAKRVGDVLAGRYLEEKRFLLKAA